MAESASENLKDDSHTSSEIYLNDLAEIQTYLEGFRQVVADCEAEEENSGDFFLQQYPDEYLTALRIKQTQLTGLRAYVKRNPTDMTVQVMSEMLDEVEPLCNDMIKTLSKLRGDTSSPPAKPQSTNSSDEDVHHATDNEFAELSSPGHHPTSTVSGTNPPPADVDETDEDVAHGDARDSLTSAAEAGHSSAANDNELAPDVAPVLLAQQPAGQQAFRCYTETTALFAMKSFLDLSYK